VFLFPSQLGCVAVVDPAARRRNLGAGFDLAELRFAPVAQVSRQFCISVYP
jgi:hypothetical protein